MMRHADITPVTCDPRSAVTPPCPRVTHLTQRSYRITVAGVAPGSAVNVPVGWTTLVTEVTLDIILALTLPRLLVTHHCSSVRIMSGPSWRTLTCLTPDTGVHCTAMVAWSAGLASVSSSVVDAAETLTSHTVTVT